MQNMRIPKFLNLEWFSQQGFNFPNLLEVQGLSTFMQMKGTFYPELVKILSQPTLSRAREARLTGASSEGGKCAESPPTFICGKLRKNRRKPIMKNIPDSGVVFMFEEGISTSHVCPKGQQP